MRASRNFSATPASAVVRPGVQRAGAAHVHVHAGIGCRDLDVERLVGRLQDLGDGPGRGNRALEAVAKDRAAVDGDDVVRARGGEADLQHVARAAARVQHRAPAALTMGVDQRFERRDQPDLLERLGHQAAFPQMIFGQRPVLHGAAATVGEMLADRHRAFVAWFVDMVEMPPVGMAGHRLDRHRLARQRIGHKDRSDIGVGYAVAAMAEAVDGELLSHAPLLTEIRHCRRRRRSARE